MKEYKANKSYKKGDVVKYTVKVTRIERLTESLSPWFRSRVIRIWRIFRLYDPIVEQCSYLYKCQ